MFSLEFNTSFSFSAQKPIHFHIYSSVWGQNGELSITLKTKRIKYSTICSLIILIILTLTNCKAIIETLF